MTRTEHLLCILAEECNEVAQRASKALRFGLTEVQPGQPKTNAERIVDEWTDLVTAAAMVFEAAGISTDLDAGAILAKRQKIERFLRYSGECGTLSVESEAT